MPFVLSDYTAILHTFDKDETVNDEPGGSPHAIEHATRVALHEDASAPLAEHPSRHTTETDGRMRRRALVVAGALWLTAVGVGNAMLYQYSFAAGLEGDAQPLWPRESAIELDRTHPTLVMVAHPHCACTRASVAELSRLMTRLSGQLSAHVVFVRPDDSPVDWEKTDLWRSASIIEGVQLISDDHGVEAARFGAQTSGQVYLYSEQGRLLFHGGITPTRAHQGDSVGQQRIISLVTQGGSDRGESAVFGCALDESQLKDFNLAWLRSIGGYRN